MNFRTRSRRSPAGFSLIELLVSVAILGLLASVAMPGVELVRKREKEAQLRIALHQIRDALDAYRDAALHHRVEMLAGASGYPATLEDLSAGVQERNKPAGVHLYFLRKIPRDPFNTDATVSAVASWGKRSFASSDDAPREGDDVFDVYSRAAGTGLNGIPYREW